MERQMTRDEIEKISAVEPYCFETDREEKWYEIGCIDGLKAADAEPNLESLWHDANEDPGYGTHILMEYNTFHSKGLKSYNISYEGLENWDKLKKFYGISRWAYVIDLLPKGGEK